jgi:Flp pilus assembly protein CpaB
MQQAATFRRTADWRVLVAALVLAAIAAGLIVAFLASRDSGTSTAPLTPVVEEPVPVVVAIQEIPGGTLVTAEMVELRYYPEETLPQGAIPSLDLAVGQVARYPIAVG